MKKFIFAVALLASTATFANAAECSTQNPCGNGDPSAVMNSWGLTGAQTPRVAPGAVIVDEGGVKDVCPTWYIAGCSDITKTEYYRNNMKELARQLVKAGIANQFPQFVYWVKLVK